MERDRLIAGENSIASASQWEEGLTKVLIGLSVVLLLVAVGSIFAFGSVLGPKETVQLVQLSWFLPTAQSFLGLAALAIAALCLGRYRALGGEWVFWMGTAFLANAILDAFYLLSWPGLIGSVGVIAQLPNTASWLFTLTYGCIALLALAVNVRRREGQEEIEASRVIGLSVIVAILAIIIGVLSVLFEGELPSLTIGGVYTPLSIVLTLGLAIAYAVAAVFAYRRYRVERDAMLIYTAVFLTLMAFGLLYALAGGKRYDAWWYMSRFIYSSAYLIMLFGFLQEGYVLFSRERARADERARMAEQLEQDAIERERLLRQVEQFAEVAQRRAAELEVANKELEAFTYSVAHDLRSPVRHMDGFSRALMEEYADSLDEQGKRYLQFVREGSMKMGRLIDDLLTLTGITRRELRRTNVNLSDLASSVAEGIRKDQPERQVEVVIAPQAMADADPGLLRIALENLLGNAWKFTSKRERAIIEFGVTQQDGQSVYYVRDNGAGFDEAYAFKLFRAFERLHAVEEFPGTGVGLATVERIIRRHGGRIWAEGERDKGATFYFTLG